MGLFSDSRLIFMSFVFSAHRGKENVQTMRVLSPSLGGSVENIHLVVPSIVSCPRVQPKQVNMIPKNHGSLIWVRIIFVLLAPRCAGFPPGCGWPLTHRFVRYLPGTADSHSIVLDPSFFLCRYDHLPACTMVCRWFIRLQEVTRYNRGMYIRTTREEKTCSQH